MNNLKIFNNAEFGSIRTLEIDDTPYFVGKDVADILGYQNGSRDINRHVDEEDRHKVMIFDGNQDKETIIINESGLYSLILSSKMPNAKKFKHWITSEVLPAIRKHGMYAIDEILENPDLAIAALTKLKEEREKTKQLTETITVQEQQISELQPKGSYYDMILNCKDLISATEIAKDYGKSAQWLNNKLHDLGVQYKQGNKIWLLYQKYAEQGYTSTKTQTYNGNDGIVHTTVHTSSVRIIDKIVDLEHEIDSDIDKLIDLKRDIILRIDNLDNNIYKSILIDYYINGLTLNEISENENYCYKSIKRKFSSAIKTFAIAHKMSPNVL